MQDLDALTTIVDQRMATIVSNSWAALASDAQLSAGLVDSYEQIFEQGAAEGIGFYFAAGDGGEYSGGGSPGDPPTLIYPQSDPWATSVGGTSLAAARPAAYEWETGWGDRFAEPTADGTSWPPARRLRRRLGRRNQHPVPPAGVPARRCARCAQPRQRERGPDAGGTRHRR